tara:strand:+ start:1919 stop:2113 length:195 start_codon:yes stop_codon:yes gene_type:complete
MNNGGNMYQTMNKITDMIVKDSDNLNKLARVVGTNTDNLNLIATRLLELEKRIKELESNATTRI